MIRDNIPLIAIATHNTIFNEGIFNKDKIIECIQEVDRRKLLMTIAYLLNNMEKEINYRCKYSISKPYRTEITLKIMSYQLYSKQGLLFLAKWVIKYGVEIDKNFKININESMLFRIFDIQLRLADYLPSHDIYSPVSYLFKNISINNKRNLKNDIARSFRMFTELAKKKEIYNENEYMDFYERYKEKYQGESIEQFLALLFPLVELHIPSADENTKIPIINIYEYARDLRCKDEFLALVEAKSRTILEFNDWCADTICNSWDYSKFLENPLIDLGDGWYLSLHEDFIINQFFEGLFYRIREAYPENEYDIITFIGRPFEKYVAEIVLKSINESKQQICKFIPEFVYGRDNQNSSDAYIVCDNKILVVEAKSKRPLFTTYYEEDDEILYKQIKKIAVDPINQSIRAYNAITNSRERNKFEGIEEVYIVSVSLLGVPRITETQTYIDKLIERNLIGNLKGYFNLDIEEFEYFCSLIKKDIYLFDIIEEYCNKEKLSPFINFIQSKGYNNNNLEWITDNFNKFVEKASEILFAKKNNE